MSVSAFVAFAMSFVHVHSGYPMTDPPNIIVVANQTQMDQKCDLGQGIYACATGTGEIYFPRFCDKEMSLECKGALIHEMTHYMDLRDGGFDRCTEKEAYKNEDIYYHQHGSSLEKMGYSKAWLKILTKCD
jgi:hypothetical protein